MRSRRSSSPRFDAPARRRARAGGRRATPSARAVLVVEVDGTEVLGPRLVELLEAIRVHGSVRQAARALGVGYRHAIARIRRAEDALEQPLVARRTGGVAGGGAGLTAPAMHLVQRYQRVSRALARIVQRAEPEILGP
jgi:molybdate transport repressor ModE-like protein